MQETTVEYRSYTDFSSPLIIERPQITGAKRFRVKVVIQSVDEEQDFERLPREEVLAEVSKHKALFDRLAAKFPMHD